jgi:hypothetical protein
VQVYVELKRGGPWSSWTLTITVGDSGQYAELACDHDEDAIWDDSDVHYAGTGLFREPPFVLHVSSGSLPDGKAVPYGNSVWGLAAWLLGWLPIAGEEPA